VIPKIIHYCWFGGNPLPELARKCIDSWKKHCSDYELILWNEDNFDVNTVPFTAQVAKTKKWGFIVDYIRAYVIYYYGGIYLDTDVEIVKPFHDDILQNVCFSGFERRELVNPGNVFAGEKECAIAKEVMDFYASYNFIQENGELNLTPSPVIFTNILIKYGLKRNNTYQKFDTFTVYPTDFFCPLSYRTKLLNITQNTFSIHHYAESWVSEEDLWYSKLRKNIYKTFGDNVFSKGLIMLLFITYKMKICGIFETIRFCYKKLYARKNLRNLKEYR